MIRIAGAESGRFGVRNNVIDASAGVRVPGYLPDVPEARSELAAFQGAIRQMDTAVGRILNSLEELGLAETTNIIIAADHGFSTGDVILEVAGKSVNSPADVRKEISDARSGGKRAVLMRVKSGENTKFVAVPLGNA